MPTRHPSHLQDTALRYFYEVVQCGTVSAASANLHVASSAISRQISGLEAQLGTPLFERHARGMVPTAAGLIVAQLARRISLDAEQAIDAINALDSLRAGTVRIATSDAFANELVPQACAAFQRQHPGVRFEVTMVPTLQVSARVLAGDADIGLRFSMSLGDDMAKAYRAAMDAGKHTVDPVLTNFKSQYAVDWSPFLNKKWTDSADTAIPVAEWKRLAERVTTLPESVNPHQLVKKVYDDRAAMGRGGT